MTLLSKYHYEKIWRPTSDADIKRILQEEMPEAPVETLLKYLQEECAKGKTVRFIDIAFKAQ